jgi:hypothetical protein
MTDHQARQKQPSGDKKRKSAIYSDKGEYRAKSSSSTEKNSPRSQNSSLDENQRRMAKLTLGTKKERSRATSSLGRGTQGRRLRGGMENDDKNTFNHSKDTSPFQSYNKKEDTTEQQGGGISDQMAQEMEQALKNFQDYKDSNPDWKQYHEEYKSK